MRRETNFGLNKYAIPIKGEDWLIWILNQEMNFLDNLGFITILDIKKYFQSTIFISLFSEIKSAISMTLTFDFDLENSIIL